MLTRRPSLGVWQAQSRCQKEAHHTPHAASVVSAMGSEKRQLHGSLQAGSTIHIMVDHARRHRIRVKDGLKKRVLNRARRVEARVHDLRLQTTLPSKDQI